MSFKNLDKLDGAIELINNVNEIILDQKTIKEIVDKLNNIYSLIEDDYFNYTNKIEELEQELDYYTNKDLYNQF